MWIHDLHLLPRFVFVFPTMISATLSKTSSKQSMDVFSSESEMRHGKKNKKISSKGSYSRSAADDNGDILRCQMLSLLSFLSVLCSNFRGSLGTP